MKRCLTNLILTVGNDQVKVLNTSLPPTFAGEVQNVYLDLSFPPGLPPFEVTLSSQCGDQQLKDTVIVHPELALVGTGVHTQAAKILLTTLEQQQPRYTILLISPS